MREDQNIILLCECAMNRVNKAKADNDLIYSLSTIINVQTK